MKICISIDMDNYQDYRSLVDPDGARPDITFYDAVPLFLSALERVGARATFFVIGRDAEDPAHHDAIRAIADAGHEVGNHSYSHPYNFRELSRDQKEDEIRRGEDAIGALLGEPPRGFRTPSVDVDPETMSILGERGYWYDSSIIPSPLMVWTFMAYGKLFVRHADYNLGMFRTPLAPRHPFVPSPALMHRQTPSASFTDRSVLEIPFSVIPLASIPFYATLYRMFPTSFFDAAVSLHGRDKPLLHMLFHLIDIVDVGNTPLEDGLKRMPGLGVPVDRRRRFIDHALGRLIERGESVPLMEIARDFRSQHGLAI